MIPWRGEAVKNYYRLMLGKGSAHAEDCFQGGFVGTDFRLDQDLTGHLPDEWRAFNKEFTRGADRTN